MDLLLKDRNKITDVVNNLKTNKPEGGANFFDRIDEFVRDPRNIDMVYHLINKIRQDKGQDFNLIVTGKFGDWVFNLIKTGKIKINGVVIHVSGSLRSSVKNKSFQIIGGNEDNVYNKKFVLLDDSYYSGSTKREIDKHLSKYNAKIIKTYVFYDGSFQKKPEVYAIYRYYDYHMDDVLPIKKLTSVLNSIDEDNIPYDVLENQIMKGQIRSIKELLREIQILKQKFQKDGSGNVDIKSYGYKREYEKKNEASINLVNKEYLTFKDLVFEPDEDFSNSSRAVITFDNGYKISVILGDKTIFHSNGIDTYELMLLDPNRKMMHGDIYGYCSKDRVTKEMIKLQKMKPPKKVFSPLDPYGEEDWEANENYNNDDDNTMSTTKFWYRYLHEGREDIRNLIKGKEVEFHTKSKKVKVYRGRIMNLLPVLSKKHSRIMILFKTKQYGVLEADNDFPIIIRERRMEEKIRWYSNGKLEEPEEIDQELDLNFVVGDNVIISKDYFYWPFESFPSNPSLGNREWEKKSRKKEIRTIINVGYCDNVKGYTGQIIQIKGAWPWYQTTNIVKYE